MRNLRDILLYHDGLPGILGMPDRQKWKLIKWMIPSGSVVRTGDIIAHFESEVAVMEHEVHYDGVLSHILPEGEDCPSSTPFAAISCGEEQYGFYIKSETARRITITVSPAELSLIEDLRKNQSRETFVLRMFQAGIKTESNK